MQIPSQGPVVVGVDGSPAASAAVRLAAREALSRDRMLQVVHAFTWQHTPGREAASRIVDEALATAQRCTPGVRARGELVDGPPGRVLLRLSRNAVLLVLGADHEQAEAGRLPPGSPLVEVVSRAWCPVAVVRATRPPSGPVLAALDGSASSVLALRFAAEEAVRRGSALHAVHVAADAGQIAAAAAERLLNEALTAVPEISGVRRRVLTGPAAEALVRASRRAGLLVLGPRGADRTAGLGAVADQVLRRGSGTTVFVHAARSPARRPASPNRVIRGR
jgi:nucleotide-binding universal stress UspA family protein